MSAWIWIVRALLLVSCAAFGAAFGHMYARRVAALSELAYAVSLMRAQVMRALPLSEALVACGHPLLCGVGARMIEDASLRAPDALSEIVANSPDDLPLSDDDISVVSRFIELLSRVSREDRAAIFDETLAAIEAQLTDAKARREKNTQVCRTMGFLGGLALMLLTL